METEGGEGIKTFVFSERQTPIQRLGIDSSEEIHEKLRGAALLSMHDVDEPTRIITPSWYTFDASKILPDIPDAVVVCTSTCKHEPPFNFFVGKRKEGWQKTSPSEAKKFVYELQPLGRALTATEKNNIYDRM